VSNPLHYALVVGINRYPGISDLNSSLRDADAFYDWLIGAGGVPTTNVQRIQIPANLTFPTIYDARPSRDEVNSALRKINAAVKAAIKPRPLDWQATRLYIYVSGHGIAPDGAEAALLMANAGPDAWGENIPCAAYLRRYEKCQYFREVVVFADCCRLRQAAEFSSPTFDTQSIMGRVDTFLGFATQLGDAAYEPSEGVSPDEARSFFTQALLEGLNGAAADRTSGEINTLTLAKYTTERVKVLTNKKRYPQVPKMLIDPAQPIVFGNIKLEAIPKRNVTILFPLDFKGQVALFDAKLQQLGTHNADHGNWPLLLEDGLYEVRSLNAPGVILFRGGGLFRILGVDRDVQM